MKRDKTPDYIRGQADMFNTIRKLYFVSSPYVDFETVLKTDARTAEELWEKWLLFGRHRLAETLVGHPRYMGDRLEKSEEEYNRCQYDFEYRDKVEKQFNEDMNKLREAIIREDESE